MEYEHLKELSLKDLALKLVPYEGKRLSTDEAADIRNIISALEEKIEGFDYKTGEDYILFKWGTIKGVELKSKKGKKLQEEYFKEGVNLGCMNQEDTDKQREIIMKMIDECDGTIQSDWSGECFTKENAKKYISDCK